MNITITKQNLSYHRKEMEREPSYEKAQRLQVAKQQFRDAMKLNTINGDKNA